MGAGKHGGFSCGKVRRLAERAMVAGLAPREARRLDRLLDEDPGDREAYTGLARTFQALEGVEEGGLCSTQQRRVLDGVLAQVAPGSRSSGAAGWGWVLPRLVPALAAFMALVVGGILLSQVGEDDPFQPRGGGSREDSRLQLRAFCLRQGAVVRTYSSGHPGAPAARCLGSDHLQLMLTHKAGYPYLLVFGQHTSPGRKEALTWYYPAPPTGESGPAPRQVDNAPLGQGIRLNVNHRPGRVRLLAVFSREPLSAEVLFTWIKGLGPRDSAAALIRQLSGHKDMAILERWVEIMEPGVTP